MQTLVREDEKTRSTEPDSKTTPQKVAVEIELGHAEARDGGADGLGDYYWEQQGSRDQRCVAFDVLVTGSPCKYGEAMVKLC